MSSFFDTNCTNIILPFMTNIVLVLDPYWFVKPIVFVCVSFCLLSTHTPRLDDGITRMYYVGQNADGSTAMGVAKTNDLNQEFVREQAQFSFA